MVDNLFCGHVACYCHNFKEEAEILSALFELVQLRLNVSSITHRLWSLSLPTEERGCVCPLLKGLELPFCPVLLQSRNALDSTMSARKLPSCLTVVVAGCCWFPDAGTYCQLMSSLSFTGPLKSSSAGLQSAYSCPSLNWYQGLSWTSENKWRGNLVKKKTVNLSTLLWEVFLNLSLCSHLLVEIRDFTFSILTLLSVLTQAASVEVWTQRSFYLNICQEDALNHR